MHAYLLRFLSQLVLFVFAPVNAPVVVSRALKMAVFAHRVLQMSKKVSFSVHIDGTRIGRMKRIQRIKKKMGVW